MDNHIEKYGIEILRFIDDYGIQTIMNGSRDARTSNRTIALAILYESKELQSLVLKNLNRIRREKVGLLIEDFLNNPLTPSPIIVKVINNLTFSTVIPEVLIGNPVLKDKKLDAR